MSAQLDNVVDVTRDSEAFMRRDLMRSGLIPDDFPISPVPLRPTDEGHARYRIHYTDDYHKDRIDRSDNKYIGPAGVKVPMPVLTIPCDEPSVAKFSVGAVEGYKKGLLFTMTTGIPSAVLDGCWSFGVSTGDDQIKQIKNELLERLSPDKIHIALFDGDWSKPSVGKAIATYSLLLDELGINAVFPDLGVDSAGNRQGYDDWFVNRYGTDRFKWPEAKDVIKALLALPRVPVSELETARAMTLSTADRFNNSHVDFSDRGNATLFTKLIGKDDMRFIVDADKWVFWDDDRKRWVPYGGAPMEMANEVARHYFRRAEELYRIAEKTPDDESRAAKKKALEKQAAETFNWARDRCSSNGGRKAVLEDVREREDYRVTMSAFDMNPNVLAVANGVVDLRTGELREERREDMLLNRAAVPYHPTEPTGESVDRIKMFVRQITGVAHGTLDATTLSWLQRRLGASLRGYNALDALEIWHGAGSNGKSVLSTLVEKALGGYAVTIPPGVILTAGQERNPEAATPFLMMAVNKRIVFMSETKDTSFLDEQTIKRITGGDRLPARANYKDGAAHEVTFTPILLVNDIPNVAQGDMAFWDRVALFDFRLRWRRPNRVDWEPWELELPLGDLWIRDEAKADPKVLEWILWWMVQGGVEWESAGRILGSAPAHIVADVAVYKESQNKLGRWMEDEGWEYVPEARTLSKELYASYTRWMGEQGHKPVAAAMFSKRLVEHGKGRLKAGLKADYGKSAIGGIRRIEGRDKY